MPALATVRVSLSTNVYDVTIGPGALGLLPDQVAPMSGSGRVFLVADRAVERVAIESGRAIEARGLDPSIAIVESGEHNKVLERVGTICGLMIGDGIERDDPLVAIGGGVVGDLAGFAAASYRRGIDFVQCPTTLLAMVDASVGGKTGVNLYAPAEDGARHLHKNMVGAFHQPAAVIADTSVLASLPERDFRNGLAECVKHAMISDAWGDPGLFDWTRDNGPALLARDQQVLTELVRRNVQIKANVIADDERELAGTGGRALLNLGHTFGHAIETLPGLRLDNGDGSPLGHGEAVSLGLVAASHCARSLDLCGDGVVEATTSLLTRLGLPVRVGGLPDDAGLLELMRSDKKVRAGRLRLVLPTGPGVSQVIEEPDRDAIFKGLRAIRSD